MPHAKTPLILLLTGAILASVAVRAFAQAPESVSAKIITLSWNDNIKELWYQTKDGPMEMEASSRGLTSPVEYTGPAVIHFHPNKEIFSLPPEERPAPRAIARLPQTGGDVLFIFTSKEDPKSGWNIRVVDNSPKNFPPGTYRFLNLTDKPLHIALDGTIGSVRATSTAIIRPPKGEDVRGMNARIALGTDIIYSSIWGHEEKRRGNVFIVPDPYGRNGINVRQFYQAFVPDPTER